MQTFQDLIARFEQFLDCPIARIKVGDTYQEFTYLDAKEACLKLAAYLQNKGFQAPDTIALTGQNCPEWIWIYYGIVYNGLWAVPLDAELTMEELQNLLQDSQSKVLLCSGKMLPKLQPLLADAATQLPYLTEVIVFREVQDLPEIAIPMTLFSDILSHDPSKPLDVRPVHAEDVASLIYTSGTTGNPKGVLLTHKNLCFQMETLPPTIGPEFAPQYTPLIPKYGPVQGISRVENSLSFLPLHHTFQFAVEQAIIYVGGSITYLQSMRPTVLMETIREAQVTLIAAIPMLWDKIIAKILGAIDKQPFPIRQILKFLYTLSLRKVRQDGYNPWAKACFRSLRQKAGLGSVWCLVSGGGPLSAKTAEDYAALGFTLSNGYGLTETSPVISLNPSGHQAINRSVGVLLPLISARILNPNDEGYGEIAVRSPGIMKGYFKNPEATEAVMENGWLHTGDMGYLKQHFGKSYIYIAGRSKNLIVTSGGKNVYPEELEEGINASPLILESLVIGLPESAEIPGEFVYAYVVPDFEALEAIQVDNPRYHQAQMLQDIDVFMKDLNRRLKPYQTIREYLIRTEPFPKTASRKIRRTADLLRGSDFQKAYHPHS